MENEMKEALIASVRDFRLPRYAEITNVGLYLEQVTRFVNTYLQQLGSPELTPSMVSNYVKQKTIPGPARKAYSADSIAYLLFVAFVKNVMSMEDIRLLEGLQRQSYSQPVAYNYFCDEFENVLHYVFGLRPDMEAIGVTDTGEKDALRAVILASVQKIYLDHYLCVLRRLPALEG